MKLTSNKINRLYKRFKLYSLLFAKVNLNSCSLALAKSAAHTAYNFYLDFKDDELESLFRRVSQRLSINNIVSVNSNICVFFDSFSMNSGLTRQYLKAIKFSGFDIVYISENYQALKKNSDLNTYLTENSIRVIIIDDSNYFRKAQKILNEILLIAPKRVFAHISPSAVSVITALNALPKNILKYQINLTDHTFWIGSSVFDYFFEFREYGCWISHEFRRIDTSKLLYLPFYPVVINTEFMGFESYYDLIKDKVIVFSGGAHYKISDSEDTYFHIVKRILDDNKNCVILYAGVIDDEYIKSKIDIYNLHDRFIPIGYRYDIYQVFNNIDIYLDTYPINGGLMLQYAALCSKPILSYKSELISSPEEYICQKKQVKISSHNIEELAERSRYLINNYEARFVEGSVMRQCVISESEFNNYFKELIDTNMNVLSPVKINEDRIIVENNLDAKIYFDNNCFLYHKSICRTLKFLTVFFCLDIAFALLISKLIKK